MKKIFLFPIALMFLAYGCTDVNDKFDDWLPEALEIKNIINVKDTFATANIATILSATRNQHSPDSVYALKLNVDKVFSDEAPADILLHYWLKNKHYTASVGSRSLVTYPYKTPAPNSVTENRTEQFVLSRQGWVFDPTYIVTFKKGTLPTDDYMIVVKYVIDHQAIEIPALVNANKNTEFYYGFNGFNGNVTYREKDRLFDPEYPRIPTDATAKEKKEIAKKRLKFCNERTIEGLITAYLPFEYPNAPTEVNGVTQMALITLSIYNSPGQTLDGKDRPFTEVWTYTFQSLGNKEWKYIQRESLTNGEIQKVGDEE